MNDKGLVRGLTRKSIALIACLVLALLLAPVTAPTAAAVPTAAQQRQLVPAYFRPTSDPATNKWVTMCNKMTPGSIAIMNPNSGPGVFNATEVALYKNAIQYCQGRGQKVVGYLTSDYGQRTLAQVYAEIDTYYSRYPNINGIFVDEMLNCEICVFQNGMSVAVYYSRIRSHLRQKSAGLGIVVGNPGAAASTNWQVDSSPVADIIVVFEGPRTAHAGWTPPSWVLTSPYQKLAQLVYGVTAANRVAVCNKTRSTNAGFVYVTDDALPNPWDQLPGYGGVGALKCP